MKNKFLPLCGALIIGLTACGGGTSNPPTSVDPTTSSDPTTIEPTTSVDPTTSIDPTTSGPKFKFSVEDLFIYANYPGDSPLIETNDPSVDINTITYDWDKDKYNEDALVYDGGLFRTTIPNLVISVTATLNGETDRFSIYTSSYAYEDKVAAREKQFDTTYKDYVNGTLFIGDSFFDTDIFWTDFYTTFSGKNARSVGISATQSRDWKVFGDRIVYPTEPENIVMHIGTNDMYDRKDSADQTIISLIELMELYHLNLPDTHIYYFGIEPRTYTLPYHVNMKDTIAEITKVNEAMIQFAEENDYFTYLDSPQYCYTEDGSVKASFFKDGTHPKLENYKYYVELLEEAGITYKELKGVSNYTDFTTKKTQNSAATGLTVIHQGTALTKNYGFGGTIEISDYGTNGHIIFSLDSTNFQNRFLLWDHDSNGTFNIGYAVNGSHVSSAPEKDILVKGDDNLVITWGVIATEKNAYLVVNEEIILVMINAPLTCLFIASEFVETSWTDFECYLKDDDLETWELLTSNPGIQKFEDLAEQSSARSVERF